MNEKKYWDEKFGRRLRESYLSFPARGDMDEINKLREWIGILRQAQDDREFVILDVGPGTGLIYACISGSFPDVFTADNYKMIELSPVAAEYCKKMTGIEPFVIDDPTKIPMGDNSVDLVICHSVLMHTPPEQVEKLFAEIVRVSKQYVYVGEYMTGTKELAPHNWVHDYCSILGRILWCDSFAGKTEGRYCFLSCKHILSKKIAEVLVNPQAVIDMTEIICPDYIREPRGDTLREPQSDADVCEKKIEKNVRRSKSGGRKTVRRRKK